MVAIGNHHGGDMAGLHKFSASTARMPGRTRIPPGVIHRQYLTDEHPRPYRRHGVNPVGKDAFNHHIVIANDSHTKFLRVTSSNASRRLAVFLTCGSHRPYA